MTLDRRAAPRRAASGFTLVELMVALALSLLVVLAAMASLLVTNRGFATVDEAERLRENASFVAEVIKETASLAGYKDIQYLINAATPDEEASTPAAIEGLNNRTFANGPNNASTGWGTGATGAGSDVLYLRYQPARKDSDATAADAAVADCVGSTITAPAKSRTDRIVNVFYVRLDTDDEPSLYCAATDPADHTKFGDSVALVSGVESFQVLYGVPVKSPVAGTAFTVEADLVPYTYLRADQMVVAGKPASTASNWKLVRSIRIGMVLRGAPQTQQQASQQTYYPFGLAKSSADGAAGSAFASTSDPGTTFVAPADGRLREAVTFTIHLHNDQGI